VFSLIEQGAASPEDIEKALKFGPGFRSATTGMLEVADMGGLDLWCAVEDNLFKELNNSDKACDYLRQKVSEKKLGLKTGEGFFTYPEDVKAKKLNDFNKRLIIQLKASRNF
jgi:3-hydroxybutyryl-CoA dehydrogenase